MTDTLGRESIPDSPPHAPREWHRVVGLLLFLIGTSVVGPFSLVALPFLLMVLGLPVRRPAALVLAMVIMGFSIASGIGDGVWFLERAWGLLLGGSFLGFTLIWPRAWFIHRALGAVATASAVAAVGFAVRPGSWTMVDWGVQDRLMDGVTQAMALVQAGQRGGALPSGLEASVMQVAEVQAHLFPAALGLASLAGLAVAWWLYARVAVGRAGALSAVREFRFQDQLVWLLIGGVGLLTLTVGDGWARLGHNTVVLMGGLYILRGVGVALFLNGGLGVFGAVFLAASMLLIAPVILIGAFLIGLGDTWLDVRTRVRKLVG